MTQEHLNWRDYCFKPENVIGGNSVRLYKNGEEAFAETLAAVRSAREYVLLEFYSFADDSIGRLVRDLLLQKVKEGVGVYLIYDAVGSILTDKDFFSGMAAGGVKIEEFRPVVLWKPYWNWIKRDHRKIVCVDGETALVGGFNITVFDAPVSMGGRGWKDSQVRVEGPLVEQIENLFWGSWEAGYCAAGGSRPFKPAKAYAAGNTYASVVSASGMRNFRSIRRSYSYAIDHAKRYIYITNAYFLPDRFVYWRLIRAARRGVDVRIIGPYKTDHPYVRWASWATYAHMIKKGIRIYEWQGEILHSKTAVIDGIWSSVGSHNLDHRSLHYNLEMNVNVYDTEFGSAMAHVFREDLKNARQVALADVKAQPVLFRVAGKLLYLFKSWL